jgi:hypothetical protein
LVLPVALFLLPGNYFDHGGTILCPSKRFFNIECFGCGTTRAIMHLIHFEFSAAWHFNKLSFITFIVLAYFYFLVIKKQVFHIFS